LKEETMPQLEVPPDHPNVLVVTGTDLYNGSDDPRDKLRTFLYGQTAEVSQGTHDFWCVFGLPASSARGFGEGGERWSDASLTPRPMRGIASISAPPDAVRGGNPPTASDTSQLASLLYPLHTALQEVAHHWLVYPGRLNFTVDGRTEQMDVDDFIHFNLDQPFSGPLLAGRSALHWSTYMQADGSPMDGQKWRDLGPDEGLNHWQWIEPPQLSVQPSNRPAIVLTQEYNDLDLMAMGVITADEAYASTGGRFSWMEPWYSAPLPFLAGVFVAFSAQDFLYFGFDSDHRKLGVSRTDGTRYGEADLGADYHPWPGRGNTGVALRVLHYAGDPLRQEGRAGPRLIFQARFDDSALRPTVSPADFNVFVGPLPAQIPGLFDGLSVRGPLAVPPSSPDFSGFHTVATVPIRQRPLAVGLITKAAVPIWADAVYSHLETLTPLAAPGPGSSPHTVYALSAVPPELPGSVLFGKHPKGPHLHQPVKPPAPLVLPWQGRLRLRATAYAEVTQTDLPGDDPRQPPYDHTATSDKAPKVVLSAPAGDFAFGTSVAMWRSAFRRSAGGGIGANPAIGRPGAQMWGVARSLPATNVQVVSGYEQQPPPEDTYRMAFILCAPQRSDITADDIASLDLLREYWDEAFRLCTRGRRQSFSHLF